MATQPPQTITDYATHIRCTDCDSITQPPTVDADGGWHVLVSHNNWCPVLAGVVPRLGMHAAAVKRLARDAARGETS